MYPVLIADRHLNCLFEDIPYVSLLFEIQNNLHKNLIWFAAKTNNNAYVI